MVVMKKTLMDKVAIVTGASSGIGAAAAEMLAAEGAIVVAVARRADRLDALVARIGAAGGRAHALPADVGKESEANAVVEKTLKLCGCVDILVNSAGIIRLGLTAEADPAEWREQIDVNLLAPMYLSRAVLPDMRTRGDGHIVNVSSTAARGAGAGQPGYHASKWGVNGFSESMRQECAPLGIRVTVVEPGPTATEVGDSIPDEKARAFIQAHVQKAGNMLSNDVAGAILYALKQPPHVNVREIWIAPTAAIR
jgi:NADP-dependent 3-hydroxy acid dehydrogenase YdfG